MDAIDKNENSHDKDSLQTRLNDHKDDYGYVDDEMMMKALQTGSTRVRHQREKTNEQETAKKPSTTNNPPRVKIQRLSSKTGKSEEHENAHMPKITRYNKIFTRPIPKEERPASPEPEWVIPLIDLPEADNNWANAFAKAHQDPDENKLHNKINDIGSVHQMVERIVPDISNPFVLRDLMSGDYVNHNSFSTRSGVPSDSRQRTNRALSISSLITPLFIPDFGLEELVFVIMDTSER
ncbi:hypothetical protein Tco_0608784 [Tanacetum coccineum]